MEKIEVPAVLQCSGNGRWFYGVAFAKVSHPAGAQWKYGGVGNARWGGVRVADILKKARVRATAKFATNFGLDVPVLPPTPKFIRGIELEKLMDPDTIVAYKMNGETLPYYHGFPLRLIVPGWAADHSVKWLSSMTLTQTLTDAFWTSHIAIRASSGPRCRCEAGERTSRHRAQREIYLDGSQSRYEADVGKCHQDRRLRVVE